MEYNPGVKYTRESLTPFADRMPPKAPKSPKSPNRSPKRNAKKLYPEIPELEDQDVSDDVKNDNDDDVAVAEDDDEYHTENEGVDEPDNAHRVPRSRRKGNVKPSPQQEQEKPKITKAKKGRIYPTIPEQQTPESSEGIGILKLIYYLGIVCIVVGVIMMLFNMQMSGSVSKTEPQTVDYYKLFKPKLDGLTKTYPSQSTRFWKVVGASMRRLLNTEIPTYPAIIILSVPRGVSKVGACLAKDISNNLNSFFNQSDPSYINTLILDSTSPPKTKLDLDGRLINILETTKAVVIDHIETLQGSVALLFHGYCDGDNAPYKSSAIIFVLHTDVDVDTMTERFVEMELTRRWGPDLGVDEMPALLSRIANNIALVTPEESVRCEL